MSYSYFYDYYDGHDDLDDWNDDHHHLLEQLMELKSPREKEIKEFYENVSHACLVELGYLVKEL